MKRALTLTTPHGALHGQYELPDGRRALVLLLRPHHVAGDALLAARLAARGYASLSMELLSAQEMQFADATQNVPRLAQRIVDLLDLVGHDPEFAELPLALFAAGDLTPAAIRAAAQRDAQVAAVVGVGGIVDRAGLNYLQLLAAPLLLLCAADDPAPAAAWQRASRHFAAPHALRPLAPGEDGGGPAADWFDQHLPR